MGRKIGRDLAEIYLSLPELQVSEFLWTMGIWEKSPASQKIAREHPGLQAEYLKVLPDLQEQDIIGSPYAVFDYCPNPLLCDSWEDLAEFYNTIKGAGKKLILDFVPNHLAVDSPWIEKYPLAFLDKTEEYPNPDKNAIDSNHFLHSNGRIYAHGKDPYFDGWTDTIQFDFSHTETFDLHRRFLDTISDFCDGVRCDMAMLPLPDVFERTHRKKALPYYWEEMIQTTKQKKPGFLFAAEVYWNLEPRLQSIGFDFTYDKDLYDHLKHKNAPALNYHLNSNPAYLEKTIHFLENHDEPRANATFFRDSLPLFSLLNFLPGATLIHEDQTSGYRKKIPVQLGRYPLEVVDSKIQDYYQRAFQALTMRGRDRITARDPEQFLYDASQSPHCEKGTVYPVFCRILETDQGHWEMLLFNPNERPVIGRVSLTDQDLAKLTGMEGLKFWDVVNGYTYTQNYEEVLEYGLYFSLQAFHAHWILPFPFPSLNGGSDPKPI